MPASFPVTFVAFVILATFVTTPGLSVGSGGSAGCADCMFNRYWPFFVLLRMFRIASITRVRSASMSPVYFGSVRYFDPP